MTEQPNIQWFPGHMAKTKRLIRENLKLVDIVIEVIDARIPVSSRNPDLKGLLGEKPLLVALNKSDLADEALTNRWCEHFKKQGITAVSLDCKSGKGVGRLMPAVKEVLAELIARREQKGMKNAPIRMMMVGVPNSGKSSLINRLAGSRRTKVEDRPGVTRGRQWVHLTGGGELLDMPGILWPKFEDKRVGEYLAYTGAVKDQVVDIELLGARLLALLNERYQGLLCQRYKITTDELEGKKPYELLEIVGQKRGLLLSGGVVNTERAAITVLDEFRSGKIGRITLETPEKPERKNADA